MGINWNWRSAGSMQLLEVLLYISHIYKKALVTLSYKPLISGLFFSIAKRQPVFYVVVSCLWPDAVRFQETKS